MSGGVRKTSENKTNDIVLTYDDSRISDINTVYAYDFFAVNRYGIEKHLLQEYLAHPGLKRKFPNFPKHLLKNV